MYQKEKNGNILIGEDEIPNTPLNERITIQTGTAFDLTGKRIQKNFSEELATRAGKRHMKLN